MNKYVVLQHPILMLMYTCEPYWISIIFGIDNKMISLNLIKGKGLRILRKDINCGSALKGLSIICKCEKNDVLFKFFFSIYDLSN